MTPKRFYRDRIGEHLAAAIARVISFFGFGSAYSPSASSAHNDEASSSGGSALLRQGSKGTAVEGDFGARTDAAMKAFQSSRGLTVDGTDPRLLAGVMASSHDLDHGFSDLLLDGVTRTGTIFFEYQWAGYGAASAHSDATAEALEWLSANVHGFARTSNIRDASYLATIWAG